MKKATLLFLILINSFAIYSQQKEIAFDPNRALSKKMATYTGRVVNILDDKPIDNAQVIVENIGVVAFTTKNGTFEFNAPDNVAEIKIQKEGNIGMSEVFITGSENKSNILFEMIPENLNDKQLETLKQKYTTLDNSKNINEHNEDFHNATNRGAIKTTVPNTIRVLMPNGSVVTMGMDEYLKGVVPREVSPSWDADALKAQAVVARSYATVTFKHQSQGADVDTTTHCQAWSSRHYASTDEAVMQTSKVSIKYNGNIIEALFFGHCNGRNTKNNEAVWGGSPVPFLRSKSCVCGFSSYFGHGVGMCQEGDQAFARQGRGWEDIIKHYYTGVTIDKPTTTPPTSTIPVLNTPAAGASVISPVNLSWSTSVSGASCRIQISRVNTGWTAANGFTTETAATENVPVNYSTPGLLNYTWPNQYTADANKPVAGSTYYWTVRAYSAATGTSSYSPVRSFRVTATSAASSRGMVHNADLVIYPNPGHEEININFNTAAQEATLSLFDISGKQIFEKNYTTQKGANSIKENVAGLQKGMYILMLNDGEKVSTQNIIIQ
ncbi:MAG TPA: SpoIID/LytB domain-containing protein [Flavobacterium sp.]|jgi:hypothetical protein